MAIYMASPTALPRSKACEQNRVGSKAPDLHRWDRILCDRGRFVVSQPLAPTGMRCFARQPVSPLPCKVSCGHTVHHIIIAEYQQSISVSQSIAEYRRVSQHIAKFRRVSQIRLCHIMFAAPAVFDEIGLEWERTKPRQTIDNTHPPPIVLCNLRAGFNG